MAAEADTSGLNTGAAATTTRLALVIGNGAYSGAAKLVNPTNDAEAVGQELAKLGFAVIILKDRNKQQMLDAIGQFIDRLSSSQAATDAGLLYYAGHGVQIDGENYLLPTDITVQSQLGLIESSISLNNVLRQLENTRKVSLLFLDCCRNNPFPTGKRSAGGGLAKVDAPAGIFIGYSTQPGAVALDGDTGNSPFTSSFCTHLPDPDTSVSQMMIRIRREVFNKTAESQIPWDSSCLLIDFGFNPTTERPLQVLTLEDAREKSQAEAAKKEAEYWELTSKSNSEQLLGSFITQYPYSAHREDAERKLRWLWWKERFFWASVATTAAALLVCLLAFVYAAVQWTRFSDYSPGSLLGEGPRGKPLANVHSPTHCRLSCIFSWGCIGYTYHKYANECYLKQDALYKNDLDWFTSSYMKSSKPQWPWGVPPPQPSPFNAQEDVVYVGDNVITNDGIPAPIAGGPDANRFGEPNVYNSWGLRMKDILGEDWQKEGRSAGVLCQKLCADQAKCMAFMFNARSERCKLFGSKPQIVQIPAYGLDRKMDLYIPGTIGGIKR